MRIPNCEAAVVDIRKVRDYCLNPNHLRGRNKARVFASGLGLTVDDADLLRDTLLTMVCNDDAVYGEQDDYGQRYTLDFVMQVGDKQATVRSGWIMLSDEDFPRLTTCYVLRSE